MHIILRYYPQVQCMFEPDKKSKPTGSTDVFNVDNGLICCYAAVTLMKESAQGHRT